ncbi:MAG TPA: VCBS repeat-containing protein [Polyangia bacterium]|jgi:hypothetical protein
MAHITRPAFALLLVTLALGCSRGGPGQTPPSDPTGPGSAAWGNERVDCQVDGDCNEDESCVDGTCQIKRCTQELQSVAPLGAERALGRDQEIATLDVGGTVRGYHPGPAPTRVTGATWQFGGAGVTAITGGRFSSARVEGVAVATAGVAAIELRGAEAPRTIPVRFAPVALAAGDVDGDGRDEVVALGADGRIDVCHPETGSCDAYGMEGVAGVDVEVADVDGDGHDEIVLLLDNGGAPTVMVWNLDTEETGQPAALSVALTGTFTRLTAGDLDGDGRAEVYVLEDRGYLGLRDDRVHALVVAGDAIGEVSGLDVDGAAVDLAAGTLSYSGKPQLVLLRSDSQIDVFDGGTGGALTPAYSTQLPDAPATASRLALLDLDGDTPVARMISAATPVPGTLVPMGVVLFPPYHEKHRGGGADITMGRTEFLQDATSDTLSLGVGLSVGFDIPLPAPIGASVGAHVGREISRTHMLIKQVTFGTHFSIGADPARYGNQYGAVMVSCGCFHAYSYQIDDPGHQLGLDGRQMHVFVPLGGQVKLMSTTRYNATASKLGGLPLVSIPYRVGDPTSYPTAPLTLDGAPIAPADMVFTSTPSYEASEVARVGFMLSAAQQDINSESTSTSAGVNGSVRAFGASFSVDLHASWTQGYQVLVGKEVMFSGGIPPIPDDPGTPEDEFAIYKYTFGPIVYRHHYLDADGQDAAFYVLTYQVGK